jgi:putative transposase
MSYEFIAQQQDNYPISRLCQTLGVSRQGYYAWREHVPSARQQADVVLASQIQRSYHHSQRTYGSPRIQADLKAQGIVCSQRRIRRLMRQLGLVTRAKAQKPRTTGSNPNHFKYPNVLDRHFQAAAPNRKWVSDISYVATRQGWVYVAGVMDLYSRRIVGLAIDSHMESSLVERALQMALSERCPPTELLHHSDQGSQYTGWDYTALLHASQMTISMSRKGNCLDNAPMESFWATLKAECADEPFTDVRDARSKIFAYIMGWYNRQRRHSALDYLSPDQYEALKNWTQ